MARGLWDGRLVITASITRNVVILTTVAAILASAAYPALAPAQEPAGAVEYRVNAGGPALTASPDWSEDSSLSPSPYGNGVQTGNRVFSTAAPIDMTHPSVPAGTPAAMLQSERYDTADLPPLTYSFPVTAGRHRVRLYFAENYTGAMAVGARVFDVTIEGQLVLDNYDVFAEVGANKAVVKTFDVQSDTTLQIEFGHVVETRPSRASRS